MSAEVLPQEPFNAGATELPRKRRSDPFPILAMLPAWVFLALLIGFPLIKVLIDAFNYSNLINPDVGGFAGLDNFRQVIEDRHFNRALVNTIVWTLGSVVGEYLLGLGAALLLTRKVKGQGVFRVLAFIPWLVPIIVAGMTWGWMLNPDFGIVNSLLVNSGVIDRPINFLGDPAWAMPTVIFINIWRSFPYFAISLMAAIQAIPQELYEAADLDGAGPWRKFWSVTMPELRSASLIIVFIHLIWTAVNFDFIWVLTQGGPNYATVTFPILIYRYSMQDFNVGAASALSTLMLMLTTIIFFVYYRYRAKLSKEIVG